MLLYVLLTGCTPFDRRRMKQAAFEEVCRIIREEEPARPSLRLSSLDDTLPTVAAMRNIEPKRLAASLSGDLDWIVMKALEKDRDRRYASASAFADDIGRYLLDEPVEASPPSRTYRLRKYTRRNRKTILATAMVVLALLTGLGLHTRELEQLNFQLEESVKGLTLSLAEEDRLREIANQSEREARGLQYVSDMTLAGRAAKSGDSRLVSELLGRHVPKKGAADYRGIEWHVLHRRYSRSTSILATMGYPLYYLAFSPDGETMAVAGGADRVVLMDADTGEIHSTIVTGHGEVNGVEFSKDGSMLATAGDDGAVRIWYTRNGSPKWSAAGHDGESYVAQILQDESVVVSCGTDSVLRMWDAETGTPAGEYEYHSNTIESFVVSPDETLLHSIGADDMSLLFDIRQRAPIAGSRIQHAKHPTGVAFAPDGGFFAICGVDRMIRLVDTRTHRFKNSTAREPLQSIALSPDGRLLATGGRGGSIDVWSVTHPKNEADRELSRLDGWHAHEGRVYALRFAPDGQSLISAAKDGLIKRWRLPELQGGQPVQRLEQSGETIQAEFMPNSSTVIGASTTDGAFLWYPGRDVFEPPGIAEATSVAVNAASSRIAIGTRPGTMFVLDATSQEQVRSWTLDTTIMKSEFSADGRLLAVATNPDRHLWKASGYLLNVETGQVLLDLSGAKWRNLAFSPDGRRLYVSITSVDHVEV